MPPAPPEQGPADMLATLQLLQQRVEQLERLVRAANLDSETNFERLVRETVIDSDSAADMRQDSQGRARIEELNQLSRAHIDGCVTVHGVMSPGKPFRPDPDGSIF